MIAPSSKLVLVHLRDSIGRQDVHSDSCKVLLDQRARPELDNGAQGTTDATHRCRMFQAEQLGWKADPTMRVVGQGFKLFSFGHPESFHRETTCSWDPTILFHSKELNNFLINNFAFSGYQRN